MVRVDRGTFQCAGRCVLRALPYEANLHKCVRPERTTNVVVLSALVDVTSAPNALTRTYVGGSDRRAQSQISLDPPGRELFAVTQAVFPTFPQGNQFHTLAIGHSGRLSEPNDPIIFPTPMSRPSRSRRASRWLLKVGAGRAQSTMRVWHELRCPVCLRAAAGAVP